MKRFLCTFFIGFIALQLVQSASLNNASVKPRGERAESSGIDNAPAKNSSPVNTTSEQQLEFDFVNLPGYGVLDDQNSSSPGNFSCYQRRYGYYADVDKHCTMFHLCYPVKEPSNGEIVYQRFSFACSDNSIFDQQHLLCLDEANLATKCDQSADYFFSSNQRLVASLQQSAPGLFSISEEGAVINATVATAKSGENEEPSLEEAEETVAQPSKYNFNDPSFI